MTTTESSPLVYCTTHNPRGAAITAHRETPECREVHEATQADGPTVSMTATETHDPREARLTHGAVSYA